MSLSLIPYFIIIWSTLVGLRKIFLKFAEILLLSQILFLFLFFFFIWLLRRIFLITLGWRFEKWICVNFLGVFIILVVIFSELLSLLSCFLIHSLFSRLFSVKIKILSLKLLIKVKIRSRFLVKIHGKSSRAKSLIWEI